MQTAIKSGDQSVTNSATLVDATGMSFPVGANETWIAEVIMFFTNSVGGGIKATAVGPSGATGTIGAVLEDQTNSAGFFALGTSLSYGPGTTSNVLRFQLVVHNGSTAGNVKIQFAQGASDPTSTVMKGDSHIVAVLAQ